jgi:hypothetical protein
MEVKNKSTRGSRRRTRCTDSFPDSASRQRDLGASGIVERVADQGRNRLSIDQRAPRQ